jgi:hypothetical protein
VTDTDVPVQRLTVGQPLGQARQLALGLRADERPGIVDHGDSGGIVAALAWQFA